MCRDWTGAVDVAGVAAAAEVADPRLFSRCLGTDTDASSLGRTNGAAAEAWGRVLGTGMEETCPYFGDSSCPSLYLFWICLADPRCWSLKSGCSTVSLGMGKLSSVSGHLKSPCANQIVVNNWICTCCAWALRAQRLDWNSQDLIPDFAAAPGAGSESWTSWIAARSDFHSLTCPPPGTSVTGTLCMLCGSFCWSHIRHCFCSPRSRWHCWMSAQKTTVKKSTEKELITVGTLGQ